MKAVVFHASAASASTGRSPRIEQPAAAIVRPTASAICGTDRHMVRGTMPRRQPGAVLGHQRVGVVGEVGSQVRDPRTEAE